MRAEHRVAALGNEALLAALSALTRRDNQLTSELLAHLGEVDERRLFADLGFDSMWAFCTQSLGWCESTAWRRIAAARVCHDYPHALGLVASGELKVVALSLMRKHLNADNAAELFELCRQRSFRQVEEWLAARFPKPDVRDLVRRLPARPPVTSNVGSGATDSSEIPVFLGETQATEPIQQIPQPPQPRRLEPLSADRYGVHFTADTEFRDLLERVRALASHRLPSGDLKTVLQRGLEVYERELLKGRFAVGKKPRPSNRERSSTAPSAKTYRSRQRRRASKPSRYVPAAAAREVYARDGGQCTFVSSHGQRCGAQRFLQLDHIDPHARGGPSTPENLRLRCRAHNLWHARRCFGTQRTRPRSRRSSPLRAPNPAYSPESPKDS